MDPRPVLFLVEHETSTEEHSSLLGLPVVDWCYPEAEVLTGTDFDFRSNTSVRHLKDDSEAELPSHPSAIGPDPVRVLASIVLDVEERSAGCIVVRVQAQAQWLRLEVLDTDTNADLKLWCE